MVPPAPRSRAPVTLPTYTPMIPTLVAKPFHRDGWVYEEKVDGFRMLAYKAAGRVRLISRNGIDHTGRYPDIVAAVARLRPASIVLDGEIAVFDQQLRSRFEWLYSMPADAIATPPTLIAFDLLYINGRDVTHKPLRDRRTRLDAWMAGADLVHAARRLAPNGLEAWAQVLERGYEGLVAKDEASRYVGGRTRAWLKVKAGELDGGRAPLAAHSRRQEVVAPTTGFSRRDSSVGIL